MERGCSMIGKLGLTKDVYLLVRNPLKFPFISTRLFLPNISYFMLFDF